MKKRIFSILLTLCVLLALMPTTALAVSDVTVNSARANFGLTDKDDVDYVYLNKRGAYKSGTYPHFINAGSGIYHIHGQLDMNGGLPDFKWNFPNNIEVKAGGTVKLLFDGALDGENGLVWDYSAISEGNTAVTGVTNQYSMIKVKDGSASKPTNVEIHFSGKCVISAPRLNAVINAYGENSNITVVLHDDCDVTLRGGFTAAAIGGSSFEGGRNITIKTDGKYNTSGNRISYKGNGRLTCHGGKQAAAIGSSNWKDANNITVESGTVYAYGGDGGAGIGAGWTKENPDQSYISTASNIKITGGTVYAYGGDSAAAIGGGYGGKAKGIILSGGRVEATAGKAAAAIGGGAYGGAENITVSGGSLKAILTGNTNAYPIGRGYRQSGQTPANNSTLRLDDNTTVDFTATLKNGQEVKSTYYSNDRLDLVKLFGLIIDEKNHALSSAEIEFKKCENHSLTWHPTLHYQYCEKCQSVKSYDDIAPALSGIENTVLFGSWVTFHAADSSATAAKSITHRYFVGEEERSVVFSDVPGVTAGIKGVTVETLGYDAASGSHSTLLNTQTLTADSGTNTYRFKGANTQKEYAAFQKAQTNAEKLAALKMQRITVTDRAGNQTVTGVYALLTHRVECYVDGVKQMIDRDNQKNYLDVISGANLKLTFLKDQHAALDYQYFYEVTVNGRRIPTTEDNVYAFSSIQEDLTVHITTKFDETAPKLTLFVNNDAYYSTQTGNDRAACKMLSTGARVTLSAEDLEIEGYPVSGVKASSLAYLIAERPMTENELKNANGWIQYSGAFTLPDSKTSIVYAKVQDIAGNTVYAASAPYLPDETAPTIADLQPNFIYCGAVRFSATDGNGIASVRVNNMALSPDDDGKYTLAAGLGAVTVTVTDKAGHTATVTVVVNGDHTNELQSENGMYWKKCKFCNHVTEKKEIPTIQIDGAETVCRTQDYAFRFTLPEGATDATYGYEFGGLGDGPITPTPEGNGYSGTVKAEWYSDDENSFKLIVRALTEDGFEFSAEKTIAIQNEHTGGIATCNEKAICTVCGEGYGELNAENHADLKHFEAKAATENEEGNSEYWYCSGCDKYFADDKATVEISKADTVIPKLVAEVPQATSPKTGDTGHPLLWIALLFVSGGAAFWAVDMRKKSKHGLF